MDFTGFKLNLFWVLLLGVLSNSTALYVCGKEKNTTWRDPVDMRATLLTTTELGATTKTFYELDMVDTTDRPYTTMNYIDNSKIGISIRTLKVRDNIGSDAPLNKDIINVVCKPSSIVQRYSIPYISNEYVTGAEPFHIVNNTYIFHGKWDTHAEYCFRKLPGISGPFYLYWKLEGECSSTKPQSYSGEGSASCEIQVKSTKGEYEVIIRDSGAVQGQLSLITDINSLTVTCKTMPCRGVINGKSTLKVTCPNGHVADYLIQNDLALDCPLANYDGIRGAALHVCKSTMWPIAFWGLMVVVVLGQWVLLILNWGFVLIYAKIRRILLSQRMKRFKKATVGLFNDPEAVYAEVSQSIETVCMSCEESFNVDDFTKILHNKCSLSKCPYCGRDMAMQSNEVFKKHVLHCPQKMDTLEVALMASGKVTDDWRTVTWVNRVSQYQWIILIVVMFFACIAPAYGEEIRPGTFRPIKLPTMVTEYQYGVENCGITCRIEYNYCVCDSPFYDSGIKNPTEMDIRGIRPILGLGSVYMSQNYARNDAITWTTVDSSTAGVVALSGYFTGILRTTEGDSIVFKATDKTMIHPVQIEISIREYYINYKVVPRLVIYDRDLFFNQDWTCDIPCSDKPRKALGFDNDDDDARVDEMHNVNKAGWIPRNCWRPLKGCIQCGVKADITKTDMVFIQSTLQRPTIHGKLCINHILEGMECFDFDEEEKFTHKSGISILLQTLPRNTGSYPENSVVYTAITRHEDKTFKMSGNLPIFTTTLIPDSLPAPHGYVGDTYSSNLKPLTDPTKGRLISQLQGPQVTLEYYSWEQPRCSRKNFVKDTTPMFENIYSNKDGRSPRIPAVKTELQMSEDGVFGTISLKVGASLPIAFTGEINNLRVETVIPYIMSGQISDVTCKGLTNTLEGFTCDITLKEMKVSGKLALRFYTDTPHITFADYAMAIVPDTQDYKIQLTGIAMMSTKSINVCMFKNLTSCKMGSVSLTLKNEILVGKRESAHIDMSGGGNCNGFKWFSCMADSISGFFSGIGSAFQYLKVIVIAIVISLVAIVLLRVFVWICSGLSNRAAESKKKLLDIKLKSVADLDEFNEETLSDFLQSSVDSKWKDKLPAKRTIKGEGLRSYLKDRMTRKNELKNTTGKQA